MGQDCEGDPALGFFGGGGSDLLETLALIILICYTNICQKLDEASYGRRGIRWEESAFVRC